VKAYRYRAATETTLSLFLVLVLLGGAAVWGVLPAWEQWSQRQVRSQQLAIDINRLQQRYDALYETKAALENRTGMLAERLDNPFDETTLAQWMRSAGAEEPRIVREGAGRFEIEAVFKSPADFFKLITALDDAPWFLSLEPFVEMHAVAPQRLKIRFRLAVLQAVGRTDRGE